MKKEDKPTSEEAFLQRVERQRLNQECFLDIDLRANTDAKCKLYHYQGRILWLDPASYETFLQGVKESAGAYTRRIYETVMADAQGRRPEAVAISAAERLESADKPSPLAIPDITFELAYFEKREDERLQCNIPVLLLINEEVIPAETRDISQGGLQLRGEPSLDVHIGKKVRVKIAPVAARGRRNLPQALYRVVRVESQTAEKRLALACEELGANETVDYLLQIVAGQGQNSAHQQLVSKGALLTAQALLAERFYMRSTPIIPFFLFQGKTHPKPLMILLSNSNNLTFLRQFESAPGEYDFSHLIKRNWIRDLKKQIQRDNSAPIIFAVNRRPGDPSPKLRVNIECTSSDEWYAYIAQHLDQPGFKLIKVLLRQQHCAATAKTDFDLGALQRDHPRHVEKLLHQMQNMSLAGAFVDITEQVKGCDLSMYQGRGEASSFVVDSFNGDAQDKQPAAEVWPIRYLEEQRREPRYIGQFRLQIKTATNGQIYSGTTRDFSLHGLKVSLEPLITANPRNSTVLVSFPDIDAHAGWLDRMRALYKEVPYQIVAIEKGDVTFLRLKRISQGQHDRFTTDFSHHIDKRRNKLATERSHQVSAAAFRLYSSIFIEHSPTIPVFVFKKVDTGQYGMKIGMVRSPSPFMGFFEAADGEFDFNQFTINDRMESLLSAVRKRGKGEIFLSLYKERVDHTARYQIQSIPEMMLQGGKFLSTAGSMDFRFLKLILCRPQVPLEQEYEQAFGRLRKSSQSNLQHLRSEFEELAAIGDIVDITAQYIRFFLLSR